MGKLIKCIFLSHYLMLLVTVFTHYSVLQYITLVFATLKHIVLFKESKRLTTKWFLFVGKLQKEEILYVTYT